MKHSLSRILLAYTALALVGARPWAEDGFAKTGELAAPEAVQAAAVDEKFVYAIANAVVAKYDRATGKKIATSSGEARHLNSGELWQGKLYCAHSNYPQQPESSQIKVLDPESMQLSTFKDFGDYGGSITWAVHRRGHWWCNFARYGDDNARTFLIEFDDAWQPLGRWTYPPEVTRLLGRYSLSGGVWRNGELLVTGHDDPVLFRMRLPREGQVLEFAGKLDIPFTGQGIALDPATSGLVGIHRGRRLVIFASAAAANPR